MSAVPQTTRASAQLDVSRIEVAYGALIGVHDVSLTVAPGEIVALLGANGAGKSTTLKAISGLAAADRATLRRGAIAFDGEDTKDQPVHRLAERGLVHVLEGRHVFAQLTVEENLQAGAFLRRPSKKQLGERLEDIYDWFPRLRDKRKTRAGLTSGGEQQMLAIGRALLTKPKLVLLDEPSMGLAPRIVQEIFAIIARLNAENGVAFLLAEQNAALSLTYAHRAYVLDGGKVALSGPAQELAARDDLHRIYLGEG